MRGISNKEFFAKRGTALCHLPSLDGTAEEAQSSAKADDCGSDLNVRSANSKRSITPSNTGNSKHAAASFCYNGLSLAQRISLQALPTTLKSLQ